MEYTLGCLIVKKILYKLYFFSIKLTLYLTWRVKMLFEFYYLYFCALFFRSWYTNLHFTYEFGFFEYSTLSDHPVYVARAFPKSLHFNLNYCACTYKVTAIETAHKADPLMFTLCVSVRCTLVSCVAPFVGVVHACAHVSTIACSV